MSPKKIPLRMCLGCRTMKPKKELIRIVRTAEGDVEIDVTGKKSGRGAYVCSNSECVNRALKEGPLSKALNTTVTCELINKLKEEISRQ
ncbi:MAG TPA: YlxR family protein [Thermoanaerobacterales bacterium]|jgi:predicted RNA-binding protein YlxR (DUF448 family)|nr:YlxR family protein [Thermoanaerobacterales bacterium]